MKKLRLCYHHPSLSSGTYLQSSRCMNDEDVLFIHINIMLWQALSKENCLPWRWILSLDDQFEPAYLSIAVYSVCVVTMRQERPYHSDSTASRLLSEVKHCRARLVLRWGTTLESLVLFFLLWFLHLCKTWLFISLVVFCCIFVLNKGKGSL